MSVPVALDQLRAEIDRLGRPAYLLTTGPDARPHCVAVVAGWSDDEIQVGAGNTTVKNAMERPSVCLLWPALAAGEYSLIVDGEVAEACSPGDGGNSISIRPTRAVFHRPAADGGHDCVNVYSDRP